MSLSLVTIVDLATKVVLLIERARELGLVPPHELAERVLSVIARVGSLSKQGLDAAGRVDVGLKELVAEIDAVEAEIARGSGPAALNAAFGRISARAAAAVARIEFARRERDGD